MTKKPFEMEKVVEKVWGMEQYIINRPDYCLKKLVVSPGFRCSWHCHKLKTETFWVQVGEGVCEVESPDGQVIIHNLIPGSVVDIPRGVYHRFYSKTGMYMLEVSSHHDDSDVYRDDESGLIE